MKRPLIAGVAALLLIVLLEIVTAAADDDGRVSNIRFLAVIVLGVVALACFVAAAIAAVRGRKS